MSQEQAGALRRPRGDDRVFLMWVTRNGQHLWDGPMARSVAEGRVSQLLAEERWMIVLADDGYDTAAMAANLASLNEIVAELTAVVAGDPDFAQLVRNTLRDHSHKLGFQFQGEPPRSD